MILSLQPQFNNVYEFVNMGGYGGFVWSAWGLAFLVIIFALVFPYLTQKKWEARVQELEGLLKAQKNQKKQTQTDKGE